MTIIAQEATDVKPADYIFGDPPKCSYDGCHEPVFRHDLCFSHFIKEETARWDDQQAEREMCLMGVGR